MFSQRDVTVKELQHQERLQQAEKARLLKELAATSQAAGWSLAHLLSSKKELPAGGNEQTRLVCETA
jgi:hypothetical protein